MIQRQSSAKLVIPNPENNKKILWLQRNVDAGLWDIVGGRYLANPLTGLVRETSEETGIVLGRHNLSYLAPQELHLPQKEYILDRLFFVAVGIGEISIDAINQHIREDQGGDSEHQRAIFASYEQASRMQMDLSLHTELPLFYSAALRAGNN